MSHKFHAEKRKERYYKLAKEQGFRSRAAYKLIQLNKKFDFLSSARAAIDLCAAPGGWLQILTKYMPVSSMIVGVDILPIRPLPGVMTFVEDITTASCRQTLRKHLQGWQVDLVVHDGAPTVAGGTSWAKDAYQQNELVLCSLKLACEFLVEGGNFVTKIFRSPDYIAISWVLKQFFRKVEITKPVASREASSEIFAVCMGYLAPKKIDPRIFDPSVVFKMHTPKEEQNKVLNVLTMKEKRKPNRSGYDDDAGSVMFKRCSVSDFINTANPSDILATHNELYFDDPEHFAATSSYTDDELRTLFTDLRVLGKRDFSKIIRWHKRMRVYMKELLDEARRQLELEQGTGEFATDDLQLTPEELEAKRQEQSEIELKAFQDQLAKMDKEKRRKAEKRLERQRKQLIVSAKKSEDRIYQEDDEVFQLSAMKNMDDVRTLRRNRDILDIIGEEKFNAIISTPISTFDSDLSDEDDQSSDDDYHLLDYKEQRARDMDMMYANYKERAGIITKRDKKAMSKQAPDGGVTIGDLSDGGDGDDGDDGDDMDEFSDHQDGGDGDDDDDGSGLTTARKFLSQHSREDGLVKKMGKEDPALQAKRWFAQDLFADIDIDNTEERKLFLKEQAKAKAKAATAAASVNTSSLAKKRKTPTGDDDDSDDDDGDDTRVAVGQLKKRQASSSSSSASTSSMMVTMPRRNTTTTPTSTTTNYASDDEYSSDVDESDHGEDDSFYDSDDEFTESEDSGDTASGRWLGSVEDRQREKEQREKMQARAAEYARKIQQMNNAGVEEVQALSDFTDDSDARAEILALGTKMLRKKDRNRMIDDTYNKYTYNDRDELPEWFVEDEMKHSTPQMPITKHEVDLIKQQMRAIDARPISKIAESKARKKRGALRRMERDKIKADQILSAEGVSNAEKMKQLEKLNASSRSKLKTKPVKQYVVSSRSGRTTEAKSKGGGRGKGKPFVVRVDGRMKKDKQGARRSEWRKKHRKK